MNGNATGEPLACVIAAIPAAERPVHRALTDALFAGAVEERADLPGGYAFRFPAARLADVARFVANERLCCPFLWFEIALAPSGGPVWLRLRGPEGTREFLRAELPIGGA